MKPLKDSSNLKSDGGNTALQSMKHSRAQLPPIPNAKQPSKILLMRPSNEVPIRVDSQ